MSSIKRFLFVLNEIIQRLITILQYKVSSCYIGWKANTTENANPFFNLRYICFILEDDINNLTQVYKGIMVNFKTKERQIKI